MASMLDTLTGTGTTVQAPTRPEPSPAKHAGDIHFSHLVQYNAIFDPQADAFLPYMWKRMQEDDLVDYYFPGQKETGFGTFVRMMSGDAQVLLVVTDSTTKQWKDTIAGFITWSRQRMGASDIAIAGFIFFREFWDHKTTDQAAAAAFRYWFTQVEPAPVEVVLGVCPSEHVTALRYNRRIGLHEVGRLPKAHIYKGQPCDAVLVGMTKDEFLAREGK